MGIFELVQLKSNLRPLSFPVIEWRFLFFIGVCFTVAITIYGYTMYAIKQERFLDDFDMPDPLSEDVRAKKIK